MEFFLPFLVVGGIGVAVLARLVRAVPLAERNALLRLLLIALGLRFLACTLFALVPGSRIFHDDATGYEMIGMRIARGWHGDAPPFSFMPGIEQNTGYFYFCAVTYFAFGSISSAPSYVNAVLGTVTIYFIYRVARELFQAPIALRATTLCVLIPSMVLWSSMALKDTPTSLLIVIALFGCMRLKRRFSLGSLLVVVVPIALILPIRFYIAYFLLAAVGASLFLDRSKRLLSAVPKQLLIAGGVAVLLVLAGLSGRVSESTEYFSLERVSSFRRGMASTAASGFGQDIDISTPGAAITFLPLGMSVLLLAPFPWQFTSLRASFAAPEMIVWWALIPSLITGLSFTVRKHFRSSSPILLFTAALTVGYSLIHGNVGSGFRQRAQIFVLLFIFTAAGQYVRKCRRAGIDPDAILATPVAPAA